MMRILPTVLFLLFSFVVNAEIRGKLFFPHERIKQGDIVQTTVHFYKGDKNFQIKDNDLAQKYIESNFYIVDVLSLATSENNADVIEGELILAVLKGADEGQSFVLSLGNETIRFELENLKEIELIKQKLPEDFIWLEKNLFLSFLLRYKSYIIIASILVLGLGLALFLNRRKKLKDEIERMKTRERKKEDLKRLLLNIRTKKDLEELYKRKENFNLFNKTELKGDWDIFIASFYEMQFLKDIPEEKLKQLSSDSQKWSQKL